MTGYKKKWLRAGKVLEYYIMGGPWAKTSQDAEYQLYHAVFDGEVRVRHDGKSLNDLSQMRGKSFSDDKLYVLPFDFELNIEDVERIWDWSKYDIADLLARGLVNPISAEMRMETNNLNFHTLLRRLNVRLAAMSLREAMIETEFEKRWNRLARDQDLLIASGLVNPDKVAELRAEYQYNINLKDTVVPPAEKTVKIKMKSGRKPTYDWLAASNHIQFQFEHHGPLSADDPEWSCQADVERELQRYFLNTIGKEPASSTVRAHAKRIMQDHQAGKAEN
ncbi:MAG: hypothetical protein ACPGVT_05645 [Maricaulaceae bacterium]